jgi:hypothetical protein
MDTLITALRAGRPEHTPEAEQVLVTVDGATVTLTLDDGEALHFDRSRARRRARRPRWWAPRVYWPQEAA